MNEMNKTILKIVEKLEEQGFVFSPFPEATRAFAKRVPKTLRMNGTIVIKRLEKGNTIIIMNPQFTIEKKGKNGFKISER